MPPYPHIIIFSNVKDWWQATYNSVSSLVGVSKNIAWKPPEQGWIKLNIDGSRDNSMGSIAVGGVLRDASKQWIVGFAVNRVKGSVLEVETWGLFEGLQICCNAGFRKIIVESDSKTVVDMLHITPNCNSPLYSLVLCCKDHIDRD
ncbi:hypothetical protein ACOSQ2_021478 [Xanthoceras sorbifolium]